MLRRCLTVLSALLGTACALSLPDGGWVGWNCEPSNQANCVLTRLGPQGEVQARGPGAWGGWKSSIVLSPDARTVYVGGDTLSALDTATLRPRWTRRATQRGGQSEFLASVLAVSPDGRTLALSYTWWPRAQPWGSVHLLDAATGKDRRVISHPGPAPQERWSELHRAVTSLAYSPDGKTLALGSRGGGVRLRDLESGQESRLAGDCGQPRTTAHAAAVSSLIWTGPRTLISAANDETLRQWNTASGRETACRSIAGGVRELARLSPDRLLAVGAASATLIQPQGLRRLALLGPVAGGMRDWQAARGQVTLRDHVTERSWKTATGQESAFRSPPLALLRQGGWQVSVRPDLRVEIRRSGQTRLLPFFALPPQNGLGGRPAKTGAWTLALSGPRLAIGASAFVRVMTMEGDTFQNRLSGIWTAARWRAARRSAWARWRGPAPNWTRAAVRRRQRGCRSAWRSKEAQSPDPLPASACAYPQMIPA